MARDAPGVFVTGTDTGVGKTVVSAALLHALRSAGLRVGAMKPVASGCQAHAEGLRNDDALALRAALGPGAPPYPMINPYALAEPIAPHLAAARTGVRIELPPLRAGLQALAADADVVLVEGVGGWAVPLSDALMQADLVRALELPVLLVVGLRLGCLNHALLSARAIEADGCALIGWIGNAIDPGMQATDGNIATLQQRLQAPCLGLLPHAPGAAPERFVPLLARAVATLRPGQSAGGA